MKKSNSHRIVLMALASSLILSGCADDGKDGAPGAPGQTGQPGQPGTPAPLGITLAEAQSFNAEITEVTLNANHQPVINFSLTNGIGLPIRGLKAGDIHSVAYGRLGTEDEVGSTDLHGQARDIWLSYFNSDGGNGSMRGTDAFSGSACKDCLTDNQDGSYKLVVTKPISTYGKFDFDSSAKTGVYLSLKHDATRKSSDSYYWVPDSNTNMEAPKSLIQDSNCVSCHRPGEGGEFGLAFGPHKGEHTTAESCSFCHTDYNESLVDTKVIDTSFKALVHRVHSSNIGASYATDHGATGSEHGTVPQTASNCTTCHSQELPEPQRHLWKADADSAACRSCHYDNRILGAQKLHTLDIKALPDWHWNEAESKINDNMANCVQCHNDEAGGQRGAERAHYSQNVYKSTNDIDVTVDSFKWNPDSKSLTLTASIKKDGKWIPFSQLDGQAKYWDLYGEYSYGSFIFNGITNNDFKYGISWIPRRMQTQNPETGTITMTIYDHETAPEGVLSYPLQQMMDDQADFVFISRIRPCMDKNGNLIECTYEGNPSIVNDAHLTAGIRAPYTLQDPQIFSAKGVKLEKTPRTNYISMERDCNQCHDSRINSPQPSHLDGCAVCHSVAWRGNKDDIEGKGDINGPILRTSQVAHYVHWDVQFQSGKPFLSSNGCNNCHTQKGSLEIATLLENTKEPYPFHAETNTGTAEARKAAGLPAEMINKRYVSPQAGACMTCHLPSRTGPSGNPMLTLSAIAHMESMGAIIDHDGDITTSGVPMDEYQRRAGLSGPSESCGVCHDESNILKVHTF